MRLTIESIEGRIIEIVLLGLLLVALTLCASPAGAIDLSLDGRYVTISGIVQPQDARRFLDAVQDRHGPPTVIILNSNGGYLREAAWISQIIRTRGWETTVLPGAICNSACPLMWLGGTYRSLEGRLGFHSAAKVAEGGALTKTRHDGANAFIGGFMLQMGAPQALVELQPKADPCCFNYIDAPKAQTMGLLGPQHTPVRTEMEMQAWLAGLRLHMDKLQQTKSGV